MPSALALQLETQVKQLPADELLWLINRLTQRPQQIKPTPWQTLIAPFLTLDISRFTPQQRQLYQQNCMLLSHERSPKEPRLLGLFSGLVTIADDFDAPLADEALFWGAETDEFGLSLSS
jgi:hypothetical protein